MREVKRWRTAFLSLRDEMLTPTISSSSSPNTNTNTNANMNKLLDHLIFSYSESLISAAPNLPPHEVTSDLVFLLEVVVLNNINNNNFNEIAAFPALTRFVHDVVCHGEGVPLQLNSSSWSVFLRSLRHLLDFFIPGSTTSTTCSHSSLQCLSTLKCVVSGYKRKSSSSDDIELLTLLLRVMVSSSAPPAPASSSASAPAATCLWEIQSISLTLLAETISRLGLSFSAHLWKSAIEVFRKIVDTLTSKTVLIQDNLMTGFYAALLHCLHILLKDPKASLSDHVSSFVAALRMFLTYGIPGNLQLIVHPDNAHREKEITLKSFKSPLEKPRTTEPSKYRPPHLRKRDLLNKNQTASTSQSFSDHEISRLDFASSDSDYSDSDGPMKDSDSVRKSRIRVAAIECIQDLCQADPKSFTTHWMLLLPTSDVLQPRRFEATLMTCLLFDPYLKARIACASTLEVMLDGPSSVFLQVAEYKEPSKCGSFTALSISLGHILMQLHTGILYLIQRENHGRLLVSLFKILMLLISSTPYSRMPSELLPTVITSLQQRIEVGFPFKSDQTGLLTASISCLTVALTTSPCLLQVKEMLQKESSAGLHEAEKKSGVLFTLFHYSEKASNSAVCFEALQALRAVSHNYPSVMFSCWERVSTMVHGFLRVANPEVNTKPWQGHVGNTVAFIGEKLITAAIKVLDACLRAISGFKGTEELFDDKLLETPFTSDYIRMKKVSSAPLYESEISKESNDEYRVGESGSVQWSEALEKHMPLILQDASPMVRAASVTCFAGITSTVFFTLVKEKQNFILSSLFYAAKHDEAPSVRSAACRAIGVISCFPHMFLSAEILAEFIHSVEINTRDSSVSVRITASWALANICDSIRYSIDTFSLEGLADDNTISQSVALLTDCALRLSNDGDKIKSNAVRALGNLSRFIKCTSMSGFQDKITYEASLFARTDSPEKLQSTSDSCASTSCHPTFSVDPRWLERTVQAFISCVTTGNVKVQWNVCYALSKLFRNETLRLQEMDWAPSVFGILLLLLRDSSNFKIRIQAAVALAVPSTLVDYGNSFSDVVQGLVHLVENVDKDQISAPSSFKYRIALEKQMTSTLLHVLSLASSTDHEPLKDFLTKKALFLEEWFKALCLSFPAPSSQPLDENKSVGNQKKEMIRKAIWSSTELFKGRRQYAIAKKFEKFEENIR